jgi:hypothetical protein
MKSFANHTNRVVLSAARPGQGGEGYFNEQPASYWIELFKSHGFEFDVSGTAALQSVDEPFSENMLTFCRSLDRSTGDGSPGLHRAMTSG